MPITRTFFLALSRSARLQWLAVRFRPVRPMVRRFVAGERLEEAIAAVQTLNGQGLLATLDHLGENVSTEAEAAAAARETLDCLDAIEVSGVQSGVSIKLTQMGLDLSPALAAGNVERIVARAAEIGRFVRIDMESVDYVDRTLDLFGTLWPRYKNVGVVCQSYLYRTDDDVERMIRLGASVRLVKGAYDEPAEVAYPNKADTDEAFIRQADRLLSPEAQANGVFPAIATHDTRLIEWTKECARQRAIPPSRFEFQMLYGIRPGLQRQIVADGYRMRVYVPYGQQWYPYFMRRLAERPANIFFLIKNLIKG